jgi:hypothetical protein
MNSKKIVFIADSYSVDPKDNFSDPGPISKSIPEWYLSVDRYYKDPSGKNYKDQDGNNIHSWKSCPVVYDGMSSGYDFKTPCDLRFYRDSNNIPHVEIMDERFPNFVQERPPMPGFRVPWGYDEFHFAWYGEWAVRLPDGYSALYIQPINRYELPFETTSGFIDSDVVNLFGTVPFFIAKDFEGIIPKGTPFLQIIPFKRENWKAEYEYPDPMKIYSDNIKNVEKYRTPKGGVYLNEVWKRRKYQ